MRQCNKLISEANGVQGDLCRSWKSQVSVLMPYCCRMALNLESTSRTWEGKYNMWAIIGV